MRCFEALKRNCKPSPKNPMWCLAVVACSFMGLQHNANGSRLAKVIVRANGSTGVG